jgi:glycerol-1-phosphate dehydrogenase [NAD(P)+]
MAVLAEPEIIENAPLEMTTSGLGDAIAKSQSTADWVMNNFLFDEYYCPFCAAMINELEQLYVEHPERIRTRQPDAVKALFEVLFYEGLAMTMVGTSVPASGGEHLLSHVLDMMSLDRHTSHDLHGRQVGLGTILSAALYEKVLAIESPVFADLPATADRDFWKTPALAAAVERQYDAKKPLMDSMRLKLSEKGRWDALRQQLRPLVRTPGAVRDILMRAGAGYRAADLTCSLEHLKAAAMHMHEIRSRPTIVDLAWLLGVLPRSLAEIMDSWLQ